MTICLCFSLDEVWISNDTDDTKQKEEEEERATRHLNTSTKLETQHRKIMCIQLLYRLKWKSKVII